tara:strand:- start:68 stop:451 length:384 start_codon:yes stop_codon:yes gene_type:complete
MKTITEIKKFFPKFFDKSLMSQFSGKVYKNTVETDKGTYFISSEIYAYERIGEHEIEYPEKNRVFRVRFADKIKGKGLEIAQINTVEQFLSLEEAKMYLEKLLHNNGGFRISQHEANMAKLRLSRKY